MYSDFESCIFDFALERNPGDYWYDCAVSETSGILRKFDKGDWARLLIELGSKDNFWKKGWWNAWGICMLHMKLKLFCVF